MGELTGLLSGGWATVGAGAIFLVIMIVLKLKKSAAEKKKAKKDSGTARVEDEQKGREQQDQIDKDDKENRESLDDWARRKQKEKRSGKKPSGS